MKKQLVITLFSLAMITTFVAQAAPTIEEDWAVLEPKPKVSDNALRKLGIAKNASAFEILGVRVTTPKNEIRKKYITLLQKWHPDKHNNDPVATEITQLITWAYEQIK